MSAATARRLAFSAPYADTAPTYRENGLSVMPCGPGTKFPGNFSKFDGWSTAYNWQAYCDRMPTKYEYENWETWPNAGVCLALGKVSAPPGLQLIAVDIDTEEPDEVAAIRSVLPGSPVRKRGAKGETEFYLAPDSVPNRPYNNTLTPGTKLRMLDLLGHGRQTVMPPSIHPSTGEPYRWTSIETFETFDVKDLPVLPADIAERLGAVLAPFGHVEQTALPEGERGTAEASTHRQLNDAALANLDAWIPSLNLYKCRPVGRKYKAVATWRPSASGRPDAARATNLAISPDGIKDCGEGKGYTPIDLVMAACGADLDSAFRFLQERVAPIAPLNLNASRKDKPKGPKLASDNGKTIDPPESDSDPSGEAGAGEGRTDGGSNADSGRKNGAGRGRAARDGVSAAALMAMEFAPIKWVVPGFIPEGLTLLAGAPKIGKSWMALGLALAVASGGKAFDEIDCEPGPVLYLALEDNLRRIQSRLRHMSAQSAPAALTFVTTWSSIEEDCVRQLDMWVDDNPDGRLIVVDVFAKIKSARGGNTPQYEVDYKAVSGLQRLAIDRGVAIILVHHTRKQESEDPFDGVSGTRGLTGSADSTFVLTRGPGQPSPALYGRGRDIEEVEKAMLFDPETGRWSIAGPVAGLTSSPEQQAILNLLRGADAPMALAAIAEAVRKSPNNVGQMLKKMVEKGSVRRVATGLYEFAPPTGSPRKPWSPKRPNESDEFDES